MRWAGWLAGGGWWFGLRQGRLPGNTRSTSRSHAAARVAAQLPKPAASRTLLLPPCHPNAPGAPWEPTWKWRKRPESMPSVVLCPCDSPAPTMAPMCIIGPSGPTGSPEPTAVAADRNLTKKVLMLRICGTGGTGGTGGTCGTGVHGSGGSLADTACV